MSANQEKLEQQTRPETNEPSLETDKQKAEKMK